MRSERWLRLAALHVRLSDVNKQMLTAKAEEKGVTVSELVRRLIYQELDGNHNHDLQQQREEVTLELAADIKTMIEEFKQSRSER